MPKATKKQRDVDIPGSVFGPIPGIKVGKWWATRKDCSADHVHPPWIAGIYGRKDDGARSVVLSGDSEFADEDKGEQFTYIGSGGRAPGVRFGPQTENQSFENNCNAALRRSALLKRPVRVIRGAGQSIYTPWHGYRYDGLYEVANPRIEPGPTGFLVCKFDFKRLPYQDPFPTERGPRDKSDIAARRREYLHSKPSKAITVPRHKRAANVPYGSRKSPTSVDDEDDWEDDDLEGLFTSIDEIQEELSPVQQQLDDLNQRGDDEAQKKTRRDLLIVIGRRVKSVLQRKKQEGAEVDYWWRQLWSYVSTKLPTDKVMEPKDLEALYLKYEIRQARQAAQSSQALD